MTSPPATLSALVKAAQKARGWSQSDLVKHCDITAPELSRLESGTKATLAVTKLLSMAKAFAAHPAASPSFEEPSTYEAWVVLLTETDTKGRAVTKRRRAA